MGNKRQFERISVDSMANKKNVFSKTSDLIVSKDAFSTSDNLFDWKHPYVVEGVGFTFCKKGTASVKLNLTNYQITENTIGIILPNSVVQIIEQSPDFEIGFLLFSFDFISSIHLTKELGVIAARVEQQPTFVLEEESFEEVLGLHNLIVRQYEKNTLYSTEIVKSLLHTLIFQLLQHYSELRTIESGGKRSRHEEVYRRFMNLLFQHYKEERNVQFYADKLFLTPKYFSKVIRNISGKTAGEWIDEMVIMAAKGMLKSSQLTVAQISEELNFANPSFFGSYFKSKTGQTPLQYKRF